MKKIFLVFICGFLIFSLTTGCGKNQETNIGDNNNLEIENDEQIIDNHINSKASNNDKLIFVLNNNQNQKYLVQIEESNIANEFECSKEKCGNEKINVNSISQIAIADNTITMTLNNQRYMILTGKNILSNERLIQDNNNSYLYYNDTIKKYTYYFKIGDQYIKIVPTQTDEAIVLQLFDYLNNNLTVMTVDVDAEQEKINLSSAKDNNNSYVDISDAYFVNDFVLDYTSNLGFNVNNPLHIKFYSNTNGRMIDLMLSYLVNKPDLEKITFEITNIDESDFNHYKDKQEEAYNVGEIELYYYIIDRNTVSLVINVEGKYFDIRAKSTYFTNEASLNSLKEVLTELLEK